MNNSTNNKENNGFDPSEFTYGVAFVIGLIFLLVSIALACVRLRMARGPNMLNILAGIPPSRHARSSEEDNSAEQGLHQIDKSFERYPKLLYSQVEKGSSSSSVVSSSCSICLGDYKESDTLRLLPHCDHLFHLACVDPWLRLHSTCPICRKSSIHA
ncbi:putative RING-H2 finger protein ATL71 [Glycine soja]|uniref:Putative RING-H2 finger protein ATL71 n=1 Tax=Glycine soja TaxID=3848 RepID=A0A445IPV4_GLYSO|nr:putative RING-H2 finger protein ATL71 [Glycine soja]KAG4983820.1 hypothetical protein JHK87_028569 [Glycine soja]KAG5004638.1 hypothetical protein JHK86_028777 [Glycine max]KHN37901.1 Putative RING-H2 finger protein ATL71 [Glycine soja]RZB88092.1 putative RING-H2 finger protein ATL71 [Glycine soja]